MAPAKTEELANITTTAKSLSALKPSGKDFGIFRELVPLVSRRGATYLNASFAPPSVHAAINEFNSDALLTPSPKPQWQANAEETRALIARYMNAESPAAVALVRDTTEGLNSFIRGVQFQPGDNVVVLDSEHPNHVYGWMALRSAGLEVRQVRTIPEAERTGQVTAANATTFAPYVDARTRAIGISSVMFHSGQWNDIKDISDTYRPRGIHILADMTQQVGFAPIDVRDLNVSAASFSLHKGLNTPTGLAALYVSPDVITETDPVPPIVGFGAVSNVRADLLVPADPVIYHPSARRYEHLNLSLIACAAAKAYLKFYLDVMGPEDVQEHLYTLGDALREGTKRLGVKIVGPETRKEHAPHLYVLDLHDPQWTEHLKRNDVYVTPYRLGIRISFGFYNNLEDVAKLIAVIQSGLDAGIPALW